MKKKWRNIADTKKFLKPLKLSGVAAWDNFCDDGKKPKDIPRNAARFYKKTNDWKGWGDFLGTGNVAPQLKSYRTFDKARKFVRKLKLPNQKEWKKYCGSGKKPDDIPSNPNLVYKNKGWKGFPDWLGTDYVANQNRKYRLFEKARDFVRTLGLDTRDDWDNYCKSGNKPDDIPSQPVEVYTGKGWKGIPDWLGTDRIANQIISKNYLPFKESREVARQLAKKYNLKTFDDWKKAVKEGKIPKNIPMQPNRVYKKGKKK